MHVDTPGQDTQNNWPVGATGFGLGTFDQPDPDALAPAGAVSTVAARATDAMTAKMTRSRTVRIRAPPCYTRAHVAVAECPPVMAWCQPPRSVAALSALDVNKRAVTSKDYRHTIPRACKDLRWEAGDLRITSVFPCAARRSKARASFM